jgi:hypothetical protein
MEIHYCVLPLDIKQWPPITITIDNASLNSLFFDEVSSYAAVPQTQKPKGNQEPLGIMPKDGHLV